MQILSMLLDYSLRNKPASEIRQARFFGIGCTAAGISSLMFTVFHFTVDADIFQNVLFSWRFTRPVIFCFP